MDNRDELILEQLKDLKENQREIKAELRELRTELQTTKRELNGRMDKLENEIQTTKRELSRLEKRQDRLDNKIDERFTNLRCSQIFTASVAVIALAVIYFVSTH